jgi:hypothetical protein
VPPLFLLATLAPWRFLLPPLDAVAVTRICSPTLARVAMRPDAHARPSLRLVDATRLWCLPSLLAGGNALVATFRERLAAVPRFETP